MQIIDETQPETDLWTRWAEIEYKTAKCGLMDKISDYHFFHNL